MEKNFNNHSRLLQLLILIFIIAALACSPRQTSDNGSGSTVDLLEKRVQQLEDRVLIRQLLVDYGRFLDQRDFASFSNLFEKENGEWIGGMGEARGSEAIRKLMEEKIGAPSDESAASNFHLFSNDTIVLDGDRATGTVKWVFVIQNPDGRPQPFYLGHYEDRFIRTEEGWKFLKRTAYTDIPETD